MRHADFALAVMNFGSGIHWLIILFVALLLFGRRLPDIMRGLGGSMRAFKKGLDSDERLDTGGERSTGANPSPPPSDAQTKVPRP